MYAEIAYQAAEGTGQAQESKDKVGADRQSYEVDGHLRELCLGQYMLLVVDPENDWDFITPGACVFTHDALSSVHFLETEFLFSFYVIWGEKTFC